MCVEPNYTSGYASTLANEIEMMSPAPFSQRSSCMRVLRAMGIIGVGSYLGVVVMLMFFENRMVFRPVKADQHWVAAPSAAIQDVELTLADGGKVHGWWCKCKDADGAILHLHGNGGNLSHRGATVLKLVDLYKMSVLILDYPGYGKSPGSPSEMGCYDTADAGYAWLVDEQKIDAGQIVLYGESLGGGVAVDLASRKDHRAIVLVKTFTSMPDVGQQHYPWLPVRWLMRNRFNSLNKIEFCHQPVFVASSPEDEVIPYSHGERLFEAANEPKQFFTLNGGHNDPLPDAYFKALKSFLLETAPSYRGTAVLRK